MQPKTVSWVPVFLIITAEIFFTGRRRNFLRAVDTQREDHWQELKHHLDGYRQETDDNQQGPKDGLRHGLGRDGVEVVAVALEILHGKRNKTIKTLCTKLSIIITWQRIGHEI